MRLTGFSENQFVQSFINQVRLEHLLGINGSYFQQIGMLNGVPDVLTVENSELAKLKEFVSKYPSLNLLNGHAKLITHLSNKSFHSKDYLLSRTGLSESHFKKSVTSLVNMNVVEVKNNEKFRLVTEFNLPEIKLWSFEFKLHNWQSALRQSMRYRAFSSYVFVVMPADKRQILEKNIQVFNKFNIGALVFNPNLAEYEFVTKPIKCGALSRGRYIDALGRIALTN